jgi:hypothetical protein
MAAIAIVISEILKMIDETLVYIGKTLTFSREPTKTEQERHLEEQLQRGEHIELKN